MHLLFPKLARKLCYALIALRLRHLHYWKWPLARNQNSLKLAFRTGKKQWVLQDVFRITRSPTVILLRWRDCKIGSSQLEWQRCCQTSCLLNKQLHRIVGRLYLTTLVIWLVSSWLYEAIMTWKAVSTTVSTLQCQCTRDGALAWLR